MAHQHIDLANTPAEPTSPTTKSRSPRGAGRPIG